MADDDRLLNQLEASLLRLQGLLRAMLGKPDDDGWTDFLAEHPELTTTQLNVAGIDDDAIVAAVDQAVENWRIFRAETKTGECVRASAHCVALALAGGGPGIRDVRVGRGDVISVGRRLGKLAREGRVRIASKSWESTRSYLPIAGTDGA